MELFFSVDMLQYSKKHQGGRIMVIYFTGTGNSRFAASVLAEALGDETVDAGRLMRSGAALRRGSSRPWVFVCPTYSWQMPRVFADFIRRCSLEGCRDAYFLLTCGGEIGAAGETARQLCRGWGWSTGAPWAW